MAEIAAQAIKIMREFLRPKPLILWDDLPLTSISMDPINPPMTSLAQEITNCVMGSEANI